MAKEKATVTLDRRKADAARAAVGARSLSETIDIALDRLVRAERLRHDIEAYTRHPPTPEEIAWGEMPRRLDLGDEDVDYEAIYGSGDGSARSSAR
jgi:hypothetical protein